MKVIVRYFAKIREITGRSEEVLDISNKSVLGDVISLVFDKYIIEIEGMPLLYSVNYEYADTDTVLQDNDEIGILFPASGG